MDPFDPKPMLTKMDGKALPNVLKTERPTGAGLKSPFEFKRYGKSGLEVSEIFKNVGEFADGGDVRVVHAPVVLRGIIGKRVFVDVRAVRFGNLQRAILAAAVEHDHATAKPGNGLEASTDILFLIESQYDRSYIRHRARFLSGKSVSVYEGTLSPILHSMIPP